MEFVEYFDKVRVIEFEDRPDYTEIRSVFKKVFYKMGYEYDFMFDWVLEA